MEEFDLKYGFKVGVILRKREVDILVKNEQFKKSFVLKGFSEDYVHYLPKRIKGSGPFDGSAPA